MAFQLTAGLILLAFYSIYIIKMLAQRRKGIRTNQMARGKKTAKLFVTELLLQCATVAVVIAEAASIALRLTLLPDWVRWAGAVLGAAGVFVFAAAVWTMRDSWRAGIPTGERTALVVTGIFRVSRNPAFLGFDLVYLGVLLLFFNWMLLAFTLFAAVMLHLQILQEEAFLSAAFGQAYQDYRARTGRYLGWK